MGLKFQAMRRRNGPAGRQRAATARLRGLRRAQRGFVRTAGFFGNALELKFHDVDLNDTVVATGGTITDSINKIGQGTTEVQRIGRKCTIRSINWRFVVTMPATTSAGGSLDSIRVIMYLDKQCNGATAAVTDILESANFQSFNNLANKSRFRTLMDRQYDLLPAAGGGDGTTEDYPGTVVNDTLFKRVNIPIEFDSTAGAITEIRSNNIGVLLISRGAVGGFTSKIRLRFSDG